MMCQYLLKLIVSSAAFLMIALVPLVDIIDQFHLTNPYSPLISLPLIILMAKFYPKSDRWSPGIPFIYFCIIF